jgi:hypothetical protein
MVIRAGHSLFGDPLDARSGAGARDSSGRFVRVALDVPMPGTAVTTSPNTTLFISAMVKPSCPASACGLVPCSRSAFEDRSRRQAKRQRELNAERRALRAAKEATTRIQGSRRFRRDEAA